VVLSATEKENDMENHPHHPEDKCSVGCSTMRGGLPIIELQKDEMEYLSMVLQNALSHGQTLKVAVDGGFKFKRGESVWTPPMGQRI